MRYLPTAPLSSHCILPPSSVFIASPLCFSFFFSTFFVFSISPPLSSSWSFDYSVHLICCCRNLGYNALSGTLPNYLASLVSLKILYDIPFLCIWSKDKNDRMRRRRRRRGGGGEWRNANRREYDDWKEAKNSDGKKWLMDSTLHRRLNQNQFVGTIPWALANLSLAHLYLPSHALSTLLEFVVKSWLMRFFW